MKLTVAIPTYNNLQQLSAALISLTRNTDFGGRIIVVNNGDAGSYEFIQGQVPHDIDWIDAGENLGWCGGINLALKQSDTDLFCMMNDDVIFPVNRSFWKNLTDWFEPEMEEYLRAGGVGIQSNYIFGYQALHYWSTPDCFTAPLLIGLLAMYRRELLGDGLDGSLPGGDDYDLSIRVRSQGYELVVDRRCYVHHHGSQTGRRIYGEHWDSPKHQQDTYNAIIRKHSVRAYYDLLSGATRALSGDWQKRRKITIEEALQAIRVTPSDVHEHTDDLLRFAKSCKHITEFGTDDGTTATIFLAAKPESLTCYDIRRTPAVEWLTENANGVKFTFHEQSTLDAVIEPTDLLFVDDLHTYAQVKKELELHADKVRRYIVFHDTQLHASIGEDGTRPALQEAISEFLRANDEWRLIHLVPYNNGLTAIARVK